MRRLSEERPGRLAGRTWFLSASVPTRPGFRRVTDAAFEIEQAVVAFVRAVLAEGGCLVFGGHPSISPLVASIAAEYVPPRLKPEDSRIIIYQSRAYEKVLPNETWDMHRLGYAQIRWTRAVDDERFDPSNPDVQCPQSLELMRKTMFDKTAPDVMMAIGGMQGVLQEADLFAAYAREPGHLSKKMIYLVRTTGGAAEQLALRKSDFHDASPLHVLEDEWAEATGVPLPVEETAGDAHRERRFTPYLVMMQWLVDRLSRE